MNNNKKITQTSITLVHPFPSLILQREQIQNIPLTHISPSLSTSLFLLQIFKTTDCINDQTCTSPSFFKLYLKFPIVLFYQIRQSRNRYILEFQFHYCFKRIFNGPALKRYVHIYIYFFASLTFFFLSEVFLLNSHIKFRDLLITFKAFVLKNSNDKGKNPPV